MNPVLSRPLFRLFAAFLAVGMLTLATPSSSRADRPFAQLAATVRQWLIWENRYNPMQTRSLVPVALESALVPLDQVETRFLDNFSDRLRRAVLTEIDGRAYYRWIFHPDDRHYRDQVLAQLRQATGRDAVVERHFTGYRTASRSVVVHDPATGAVFSLKTSTNRANGEWADKAQPVRYADSALLANEHVRATEAELGRFEHVVVMREPGAVMMPQIDQAQIFRDLGEMGEGKSLHLPLFSILSQKVMAEIMAANNLTVEQVLERVGEMWGRAQAEFVLKTGLSVSSAHSQNFLIELDLQRRFTGRIVFRDFADAHLMREFVRGPVADRLLRHWESLRDRANGVFKRSLSASFMPYHGLDLEATRLTDRIFTGTEKGFKAEMIRALGPWGFQQWQLRVDLRPDRTAAMYLLNPQEGLQLDVDGVARRMRHAYSAFACRRVHSGR